MQSVSGCKETEVTGSDSPCAARDTTGIDITRRTTKTLQKVLTSSTCSVVKGPPYFDLP